MNLDCNNHRLVRNNIKCPLRYFSYTFIDRIIILVASQYASNIAEIKILQWASVAAKPLVTWSFICTLHHQKNYVVVRSIGYKNVSVNFIVEELHLYIPPQRKLVDHKRVKKYLFLIFITISIILIVLILHSSFYYIVNSENIPCYLTHRAFQISNVIILRYPIFSARLRTLSKKKRKRGKKEKKGGREKQPPWVTCAG